MEVSERKRTEAQLRNLAARLEAIREEERTASRAKSTTKWARR